MQKTLRIAIIAVCIMQAVVPPAFAGASNRSVSCKSVDGKTMVEGEAGGLEPWQMVVVFDSKKYGHQELRFDDTTHHMSNVENIKEKVFTIEMIAKNVNDSPWLFMSLYAYPRTMKTMPLPYHPSNDRTTFKGYLRVVTGTDPEFEGSPIYLETSVNCTTEYSI